MAIKAVEYLIKGLYGRMYDLTRERTRSRAIIEGIGSYIPYVYEPMLEGFGEPASASYCYSVWLKHLSLAMENGLKGYPKTVVEFGPGASIGTGLAALIAGAEHYHALDVMDFTDNEQNIRVFDELVALYQAKSDIPEAIDFPGHILNDNHLKTVLDKERLSAIKNSLVAEDGKYITYHMPCHDQEILEESSADFIFSHAVMEHVEDIRNYYQNMHHWLNQDGIMSHQIDFECHGLASKWNGHWGYTSFIWKIIKGKKREMLNRLPHSNHLDFMRSENLEIVKEIVFEGEGGITRDELASEFVGISDIDLATKGSIILAIKN